MTTRSTASGLLSRNLVLLRQGSCAAIDLDLEEHRFLGDHLVGGRPLLSTVMGIEGMACVAAFVAPDAGSPGPHSVTDVAVLPPFSCLRACGGGSRSPSHPTAEVGH